MRNAALATLLAACAFASAVLARQQPGADEVLALLRQAYSQTKFLSAEETPVDGLFAVRMERNSAFTDAKGRHFIFGGTLVDMDKQTAFEVAASRVSGAPPFLAIPPDATFSYKTTPTARLSVAVFSDLHCPYCMKLEHELARIKGLRVDVILYPVVQTHQAAMRRTAQVWCSRRPAKTYLAAMLKPEARDKLFSKLPHDCPTPIASNLRLGRDLGVRYTPTLVAPNGSMLEGFFQGKKLRKWIESNQL